jgi:hypothetical protein
MSGAELITVWTVLDGGELGQKRNVVSVHLTEEEAYAAAPGKGAWGSEGGVEERQAVQFIHGDIYLIERRNGREWAADDSSWRVE